MRIVAAIFIMVLLIGLVFMGFILMTTTAIALPNLLQSHSMANELAYTPWIAPYGGQWSVIGRIVFLVMLAFVVLLCLRLFKMLLGSSSTPGVPPANQEAESQLMQELHRKATLMEERLESLETVLLERFK